MSAVAYQVVVDTRDLDRAADVSVILPVFRAPAAELDRQLGTLLDQLAPGRELIVVDDGSGDDTLAIVRAAVGDRPEVVVLTSVVNRGVAAARNAALRQARGEFVWCVDWDDEWDAQLVARLHAVARETGADIVVCRAESVIAGRGRRRVIDGLDRSGLMTGAAAFAELAGGRLRGYLWSKLIRRSLLGDDPFPPMRFMSDYAGFAPALARARQVAFVPDVLYSHVLRDGSISASRDIDLDCKYQCLAILRSSAETVPDSGRLATPIRRFEYRRILLGTVLTAVRLDVPEPLLADVLAAARSRLQWHDLARHLRLDAKTAVALGFVKVSGRWCGPVVRLALAVRGGRR